MTIKIEPLNRHNYHDVVTLVWRIMNQGIGEGSYKRAEAEEYVKNNSDKVYVLEVDNNTMGMYSYFDNPNMYNLSFFALDKRVRAKKAGYKLYLDMKSRLSDRPVIIPLYSHNSLIQGLVRKRGTFLGRRKSKNNKTIEYYSVVFGENWE